MPAKPSRILQWVILGALVIALAFIADQAPKHRTTPTAPQVASLTTSAGDTTYAATFVFAGEPRVIAYPHELKLLRNTAYFVVR